MKLQWRLAALKNGFQDATAYRIEFLFEVLGSAFVPAAIQLVLWYSIYHVGGTQSINGMDYAAAVQYTIMSILFTQIRGGDLDFELQEMIRTGQLSNYLVRPVGVVEFVYIRGLAPKLLLAGICLPIGMVVGHWFVLDPFRMIGSMFLALIGNLIHYQISAALSTAAFLWEEAFSVLMVKNMLVNFLSGELFPLTLFPASVAWIWKSTPFYLYVFGPAQYSLGKWSNMDFVHALMIAGAWLIVGWLLVRISWYFGIKRYLSLGG
jgi:ABC-2 type transport system permease protein